MNNSPFSSPTRSHPPPTSSTSSTNFSLPQKSDTKSQVSIIKPIQSFNEPSSFAQHLATSPSSSAKSSDKKTTAMVKLLPLRSAPVQHAIPTERVYPQSSQNQLSTMKTAAVVFPTETHQKNSHCHPAISVQQTDDLCEDFIPATRRHSDGMNTENFIPKYSQGNSHNQLGVTFSDPETTMHGMGHRHKSAVSALAQLSSFFSSLDFTSGVPSTKQLEHSDCETPESASSSSIESLPSIPTTASLNKLINRPTQIPVVTETQQPDEMDLYESTPKEFFGRWDQLDPSTIPPHLLKQLYSCHKSNFKSHEVLPSISQPASTEQPQVQFFLSQKQQLQFEQLEKQKVVTSSSTKIRNIDQQTGTVNDVTDMKEPKPSSSFFEHVKSSGQTSHQSVNRLPLPNPTATKSHQGSNNSPLNKMKSSSLSRRSHTSLNSTTSSKFSSLSKSKSQVSLVKPVLISNGPSINSGGSGGGGHNNLRTSSSSSNIAEKNITTMVRSLPLKTAPVQPMIPSQRVQPQTPHYVVNQMPAVKTAAVVFPTEQHPAKPCQSAAPIKQSSSQQDFIPETRDRPAQLDLDDFLPKHIQKTVRLGFSQPEVSEPEAMNDMVRGHRSVVTALAHRKKSIQIILAVWSSKNPIKALDQAIQLEDESVLVDILNVINLKPSFWTLDLCQILLPSIHELLQSKYESYMSVGCTSLKLILNNFSTMITSNITAPPGIGVDISREERYNKCMTCYKHLLSIRAFLLKRQTIQGKLGRSFRELSILMQKLE